VSERREARLGLLLILLAIVATALTLSAPRDGGSDLRRPAAAVSTAFNPSSPPSPSQSPHQRGELSDAARKVAARWAAAYTTTGRAEPWAARLARLRPYSTRALIAEMATNSGALELEREPRTIGDVAAVQTQDSTEGDAVVVLVDETTVAKGHRSTELVSVTLELVSGRDGWRVAEVLVP
jgi:hypothetical protein